MTGYPLTVAVANEHRRDPAVGCWLLRPLQTETARSVSLVHPGAVDGTEYPVIGTVAAADGTPELSTGRRRSGDRHGE